VGGGTGGRRGECAWRCMGLDAAWRACHTPPTKWGWQPRLRTHQYLLDLQGPHTSVPRCPHLTQTGSAAAGASRATVPGIGAGCRPALGPGGSTQGGLWPTDAVLSTCRRAGQGARSCEWKCSRGPPPPASCQRQAGGQRARGGQAAHIKWPRPAHVAGARSTLTRPSCPVELLGVPQRQHRGTCAALGGHILHRGVWQLRRLRCDQLLGAPAPTGQQSTMAPLLKLTRVSLDQFTQEFLVEIEPPTSSASLAAGVAAYGVLACVSSPWVGRPRGSRPPPAPCAPRAWPRPGRHPTGASPPCRRCGLAASTTRWACC